jgi:hypothetical protein
LIAKRGKGELWRVVGAIRILNLRQENSDSDETYGDPKPGLTDDEYLERRAWHFEKMLPGNPKPDQYQIE